MFLPRTIYSAPNEERSPKPLNPNKEKKAMETETTPETEDVVEEEIEFTDPEDEPSTGGKIALVLAAGAAVYGTFAAGSMGVKKGREFIARRRAAKAVEETPIPEPEPTKLETETPEA